ncbi:hypothetical protein BD626DRAFT_126304 [Schizophyllum amplum]|uniref:Uncharacterized protein n=1 Tax=Schizophyllum amplum TaxID=97359 RepID=A0A550C6Z1_9AGAR|nr:hypothetical protein BD626DRAFT_126304 [Auriculariopsis ampla]
MASSLNVLQVLRSLGKWFSSPPSDSDKTTETMTEPLQYIPCLVGERSCAYTPRQFLDIVKDNNHLDPVRERTLRECLVDEVIHFRRDSSSARIPHEMVIVLYSHSIADKNGSVGVDRRIAKFERLKRDQQGDEDTLMGSVPLYVESRGSSREVKGKDTGNLDRVYIAQILEQLSYDYKRVASFTPARGTLDVVDCAVVAYVLTERASNYSLLHYMCMWYARILFESLRLLAGQPPMRYGEANKRAGTWGKLPIVTIEGHLVLSTDFIISVLRRQINSTRSGEELNLDKVRDAIQHDREEDSMAGTAGPLREVRDVVEKLRKETWDAIAGATEVAYERVYREDILKEELARKTVELSMLRAQIARASDVSVKPGASDSGPQTAARVHS